jgi:hypothetical protein
MNHSRVDTTQVYLRALNRSRAMEAVRDLSWGAGFQTDRGKAHTGFEPVSGETKVPEPLRRKLDELKNENRKARDERS